MPIRTKLRPLTAIAVALGLGIASAAHAAQFTVSQIGDHAGGSLRQAIIDSNATPGPNTIVFNLPSNPTPPAYINLETPLPAIVQDVTIIGPGAGQVFVQVDPISNPAPFPLFSVSGSRTVEIRGLTMTRGGGADGAAVLAQAGSLTIRECVIFENVATNSGGAIAMIGAGNATLNVIDSLLSSNAATNDGGAISVIRTSGAATVTLTGTTIGRNSVTGLNVGHMGSGLYLVGGAGPHTVSITNSTISDNAISIDGSGGGAFIDAMGGTITLTNSTINGNNCGLGAALSWTHATVSIRSCTITGNNCYAGPFESPLLDNDGAGMTIKNTIVSGNIAGAMFRDLANGQLATGNNNLIGIGGPFISGQNGNIVGVVDPRLVPIKPNGGINPALVYQPLTFALQPDSPALDRGSTADAPATDERGQPRPADGDNDGTAVADIGAFETQRYLVTSTNDSGAGSLRQAILDNNLAGGGFIKFAIAPLNQVKTITPATQLPTIMRTAFVDGWSEGGLTYQGPPLIEIDGASVAGGAGLDIQWSDCIVRGLSINNFGGLGAGVHISSQAGLRNWIYGCFIGVRPDGVTDRGNGQFGVWISATANSNLIGTNADGVRDTLEKNVISGSRLNGLKTGVYIESNSNIVAGNNIGTDVTGRVAVPNYNGVWVSTGSSNQIGTSPFSPDQVGECNVISGNQNVGISFSSQGSNNFTSGNLVGTKSDGLSALPNAIGILLDNVNRTLVGGTTNGERNIISGNTQQGLIISGSDAYSNLVQGNYIGTNMAGTAAIPNELGGVLLRQGVVFCRVGAFGDGTMAESHRRNIISGNGGPGVVIQDVASTDNRVMGNYIGLAFDGATPLGNQNAGVSIINSSGNKVGGTTTGRNFIGTQRLSTDGDGVTISGTDSTGNLVQNNSIGVAVDGSAVGNNAAGVTIRAGASSNMVGGVSVGQGNIIANNIGTGVRVMDDLSLDNSILGNTIVNNGRLGIDLIDNGVTPNGPPLIVRVGPNSLQNYPILDSVMPDGTITARLAALATTFYRVEYFSSAVPDPTGNGEGRTFLGFQNVLTGTDGLAGPFVFHANLPVNEPFVSATATRLAPGNGLSNTGFPTTPGAPLGTSEFSPSQSTNTLPITSSFAVSTLEDTDVVVTLTASDPDPGSVFAFRIESLPGSGQLLQFGTLTPITAIDTTVMDSQGRVIFRPAANQFGSPYTSFDFLANDGIADSNTSTVTVSVGPVADTPSVTDSSTQEDMQTTTGLVISRNPADGTEVTHFKITAITSGTLFQNDGVTPIASGQFITFAQGNAGLRFTPAPNFFGTATFNVQASIGNADAGIGGNTVTAHIFVSGVADTPNVTPTTTLEDTQSTSGLVITRNAADGSEITHFKITALTNGQLFQSDGVTPIAMGQFITAAQGAAGLKYTPPADFNGPTTFLAQASLSNTDAGLGGPPATANITVTPVNDPPTFAAANPPAVLEDAGPITVSNWSTNFTPGPPDEASQTNLGYTISNVTNTALFTALPTLDVGGTLRYTPAPNANGTSQFTVVVRDSGGVANGGQDTSTPQTFTITVTPVNDPPAFAASNPTAVLEDSGQAVVANWAHDFTPGPPDEASQTNLGYAVSNVSNVSLFSAAPTVDATGTLRYTPAPNANGTSQFSVVVRDSGGTANGGNDTSAPQVFTITVTPVNDPPSFTAADPAPVLEDAGAIAVNAWVTNFNPGPPDEASQTALGYTVSNVTNAALFTAPPTVDSAGVLRYTPAPNANGTSQFTVVVRDSGGTDNGGQDTSAPQTFTIRVTPVNDAPTFTASDPPAVLEDVGAVTVPGWVTNFNPGPPDEVSQTVVGYTVSNITNAALFSAPPSVDPTGALHYAPAPNANGSAQFTVVVQDSGGTANGGQDTSAPQTFTINVTPVNDPPTFTAANPPTVLEDGGPVTVSNWVTNFNPGPPDEATQTVVGYTVSNVTNPSLFAVAPTVDAAGVLHYTPAPNANGTSQFTVVVQDSGGTANGGNDTSSPQTFTITVNPVNDPPSFVAANPPAVLEDVGVVTVSGWAHDFNPGPPDEASQTVVQYIVMGITNPALFAAAPTVDASGVLQYTPAPNANGTSEFSVAVQDSGGAANGGNDTSPTQTFTITVGPVNDPPTFVAADPPAVLEDVGPVAIAGWAHDFSPGPPDEASQTNLGYTVSNVTNAALFSAQPTVDLTGALLYTPAPNANGTSQFTVAVQDSGGIANGGQDTSVPRTFTITVGPVNDPPTFTASNPPAVLEDAGAVDVAGWVTNFNPGPPDESSQTVLGYTVSNVTNAALFAGAPTVDTAGTLHYTPAPNANGTSQFTVVVRDSGGTANGGNDTSAPQTFTITVTPVNDQPTFAANNPAAVLEGSGAQTVSNFIASFNPGPADESGQTIAEVIVDQVSNAGIFATLPQISTSGQLTYTTSPSGYGTSTFRVRVRDSGGTADGGLDLSDPQVFTIIVRPAAVCQDVVLDARTQCIQLTVQPGEINHTPNTPGPGATQSVSFSRRLDVPFPFGITPVTVTVRYSDGLVSTCIANVTALFSDCNGNGVPDACETPNGGGGGPLTDCNGDMIPDNCQCLWDDGLIAPGQAPTANGQMSHYGRLVANKVADDFYLEPGRNYRLLQFTGQLITNTFLHKAVLEFYDDCDGVPAATPFRTFINPTEDSAVPAGTGFVMSTLTFNLCADCFFLEGGKTYWVSLVGLTDFANPDDASFWVTTTNQPNPANVMGLPPLKRYGVGGPPPYPITYQPWQPTEGCCIGCVNMAWRLTGEQCQVAWDNGAIDLGPNRGGTQSDSDTAIPYLPRAAENFYVGGCDPVTVCLLETYIWTNCNPVVGFAEIYRDNCGMPELAPFLTAQASRIIPIPGTSFTYQGQTLTAYKLEFCAPGWVLPPSRNYWISSGANSGNSVNGRGLFAYAAPNCNDACIGHAPRGKFLDRSTNPVMWADTGHEHAFRLSVRGTLGLDALVLPTALPSCLADFNRDHEVNAQDIFDYLSAWFTGCP